MASSRPAELKLSSRPAASKTTRLLIEGNTRRRFSINPAYLIDEIFPASHRPRRALGSNVQSGGISMGVAELEHKLAAPKRERAGRIARREQRSHGPAGLGRPYIVRNIPTYDILSEENLVRIEATADRILAEVGIEFRGDPVALDHWRRAGARIEGELVRF